MRGIREIASIVRESRRSRGLLAWLRHARKRKCGTQGTRGCVLKSAAIQMRQAIVPMLQALPSISSAMRIARCACLGLILSLTLPALAANPAAPASTPAKVAPHITWRGDIVSARAFVNDLVTSFRKERKGTLTVQPFSTISGIDAVIAGTADIAGSARAMSGTRDEEQGLIFQPIALDAIVPVTNPKNPVNSISLAQLRQLYLGRIHSWQELGGPAVPINLYSIAAPLDGVEFSFRRLLYRRGEQRIAAPRLYLNTAKLEEGIAIDPNGLGLTTLSSTFDNPRLKRLAVEGISASSASIADGSYPLFLTLYVVQREDAPNRADVDDFIGYLNSPTAHAVMQRHQLTPYATAGDVYSRDSARLAFIDAAIVSVTPADVAASPRLAEVPPPQSAPRATLQSSIAIAPDSATTSKARANLRRAESEKAKSGSESAPPEPVPPEPGE